MKKVESYLRRQGTNVTQTLAYGKHSHTHNQDPPTVHRGLLATAERSGQCQEGELLSKLKFQPPPSHLPAPSILTLASHSLLTKLISEIQDCATQIGRSPDSCQQEHRPRPKSKQERHSWRRHVLLAAPHTRHCPARAVAYAATLPLAPPPALTAPHSPCSQEPSPLLCSLSRWLHVKGQLMAMASRQGPTHGHDFPPPTPLSAATGGGHPRRL